VVISPYITAGTIDQTIYDHTSLIATAMKLFAGSAWPSEALGKRAQVANTFESLLDLNAMPRMEKPNFTAAINESTASVSSTIPVSPAPSPLCNTMPYNTQRRSKPACLRTCKLESILPRFTMSTPQVCTSPRSQPYSLPGETEVLPMPTTRFILCAIAYGLLVNALPVHAQNRLWTILKDDWSTSWDDAQKNCSDAKATKHWSDVEGCAVTAYSLKPPGPEIGSVAPGSSVALGLG